MDDKVKFVVIIWAMVITAWVINSAWNAYAPEPQDCYSTLTEQLRDIDTNRQIAEGILNGAYANADFNSLDVRVLYNLDYSNLLLAYQGLRQDAIIEWAGCGDGLT